LGRGLAAIRVRQDRFDGRFLHHVLAAGYARFQARGVGSTFINISSEQLSKFQVPLFALSEQRRIAAILDQADDLRRKRRYALERIGRLVEAIFEEMFGDPIRNDRRWRILPVGEFVAAFEGGKNIVAEDAENPFAEHRVLKVSGIGRDGYNPAESKALPIGYLPPDRHFINEGDLLISRANTSELVGRVALVHDTPNNIILPDKIWRFLWRKPEIVDPRFVESLFRHASTRYELGKLATGTSGSMKNISQTKLLRLRVAVPALDPQKIFSARIQCIEGMRSSCHFHLAKLDALFASLQHRAFRGELILKDAERKRAVA
jgi:type I restriction enzyme S subunit